MKNLRFLALGIAALGLGSHLAPAQVLEDFESFAPQTSFTTPSSTPWSRFGNAVADGLTVVQGEGTSSTKGAILALNIAGKDSGTIRLVLPKPLDLGQKPTISFDVRQTKELPGLSVVCQIESAAGTIWQVPAQPIKGTDFANYAFSFASGATKAQGSESLDDVLAAVSCIRFRFAGETDGVSSLRFDNLRAGE